MMKVQIGWIDYLNLLPLKHELQKLLGSQLNLRLGHPSEVNRWMQNGEIQLAPCSSICLLRAREKRLTLPFGVSCDGPVQSVYIGLNRDHEEFFRLILARQEILINVAQQLIRSGVSSRNFASEIFKAADISAPTLSLLQIPPVYWTPASATSVALAKVFLRLWFGRDLYQNFEMSDGSRIGSPVEILIGDEALEKRHKFARILDLGELWKNLTGEPFVFAVWQAKETLPAALTQALTEACGKAERAMRIDPLRYFASDPLPLDDLGRPIDVASYWQRIDYHLDESAQKGLVRFLHLAANLEVDESSELDEKLVRWSAEGQVCTPGESP